MTSQPTNVNKTTIKFDDTLKSVITRIKEDHRVLINGLGEIDEDQPARVLRNKIDASFNEFNFTIPNKTSFKKPDYFAIFMCIISPDIDELERWEQVMDNKDIDIGFNHPTMDYTCCCGQAIKQSCLVFFNKTSCVVGNCCVEKNLIANMTKDSDVKKTISLKLKKIRKKQKEEIEQFKKDQIKIQEEQAIAEFKKNHPTKCYICRKNCKREYTRCYSCKSLSEGKVRCDCGSFRDKKFKMCYTCKIGG